MNCYVRYQNLHDFFVNETVASCFQCVTIFSKRLPLTTIRSYYILNKVTVMGVCISSLVGIAPNVVKYHSLTTLTDRCNTGFGSVGPKYRDPRLILSDTPKSREPHAARNIHGNIQVTSCRWHYHNSPEHYVTPCI